jgi:hypothetical protein
MPTPVQYGIRQPGEPVLRDFQHASRLYRESDLRLAPKTKFLYHVVFNINSSALKNLGFKYRHQNEINMLVKSAELPKFTVQSETLNQYNRKKVVQNKIDYQPVTLRFHDDNYGVVGQLWYNYFNYYYGDTSAADNIGAYNRTAMKAKPFIKASYGLDNNSTVPFFTSIVIYQLAKKAWYAYKLINPIVTQWNHDTLDSSSSQPAEQSMTLAYESVAYETGRVRNGIPNGFSQEHYDQTPSPYAADPQARRAASDPVALGGGTSIFGNASSILGGISSVLGAMGDPNTFKNPAALIGTAITAVNTYQNAKNLTKEGALNQVTGAVLTGINATARVGLSGQPNVSFPVPGASQSTPAKAISIFGPQGG